VCPVLTSRFFLSLQHKGKYTPTGKACPSYSATPSRFQGQLPYCHYGACCQRSSCLHHGPQGDCPRTSRGLAFRLPAGSFFQNNNSISSLSPHMSAMPSSRPVHIRVKLPAPDLPRGRLLRRGLFALTLVPHFTTSCRDRALRGLDPLRDGQRSTQRPSAQSLIPCGRRGADFQCRRRLSSCAHGARCRSAAQGVRRTRHSCGSYSPFARRRSCT
jgi:hypothetical protein